MGHIYCLSWTPCILKKPDQPRPASLRRPKFKMSISRFGCCTEVHLVGPIRECGAKLLGEEYMCFIRPTSIGKQFNMKQVDHPEYEASQHGSRLGQRRRRCVKVRHGEIGKAVEFRIPNYESGLRADRNIRVGLVGSPGSQLLFIRSGGVNRNKARSRKYHHRSRDSSKRLRVLDVVLSPLDSP